MRLLAAASSSKNDSDDARSVAVAALGRTASGYAEAHPAVLKMWSKRRRGLGQGCTQAACHLRAVLCDLVSGGFGNEISAGRAPASPS